MTEFGPPTRGAPLWARIVPLLSLWRQYAALE
jgi:hypothetical protein